VGLPLNLLVALKVSYQSLKEGLQKQSYFVLATQG
jgi:hypothetical protein